MPKRLIAYPLSFVGSTTIGRKVEHQGGKQGLYTLLLKLAFQDSNSVNASFFLPPMPQDETQLNVLAFDIQRMTRW